MMGRSYGRRGRSPDLPASLLGRVGSEVGFVLLKMNQEVRLYTETQEVHISRDPRGFGFLQFLDPDDAKYHMDGYLLLGRELTVVFAEENRKKPTEMRARQRGGGRFRDQRRSSPRYSSNWSLTGGYYSPSPKTYHSSPTRVESRSISHSPRRSISPRRNRSLSQRRSRSPRRNMSYTPEPARSSSPLGEQYKDPSPSQ